jgi:glycosyltransferase involved in cell wall biosynthesis
LRKALIVNSVDAGGGAERIAAAALDGFPALGTETWMAVGHKRGNHPRVVALPRDEPGPAVRRLAREARRVANRLAGIEDFDHPGSHRLLEVAGRPEPDVVFLGNLHGDYFDLRMVPELSRRVPTVLRLADSWAFTGHCAVPLGCGRWEHGCGKCPDLTIPPAIERDGTRINWQRKRSIFGRSSLFVVSPSQWQLERARRSLLGPAIAGSAVIPNGVDLDTFTPDGPAADREALGVPAGAALLVFVCNLGAANRYKDVATLRRAIALLTSEAPDRALELLVVGGRAPLERLGERARIRHLPYLDTPEELARLHRGADLYVHAAWEETFCLGAAEALACGTPVVAAGTGGLAEVVDHGRTGLLSPPERPDELASSIGRLLDEPDTRARMGAAAAAARRRFDQRRMVEQLHAFCLEAELRPVAEPR